MAKQSNAKRRSKRGSKRQGTPEQQAQRDARRDAFRGMVKRLADMTDAQRDAFSAKCPVVVTCEGRMLSPRNMILVHMQFEGRPAPTMVGGFRQWLAAGRCVAKGEHGVCILAPRIGKEDSGEGGDVRDVLKGFVPITVFDVSQTVAAAEAKEPAA